MTDFKLSSIAFDSSTFIAPLPEFTIKRVKPLDKGCHDSYRLYACHGCGKQVSICMHCDRGNWYCFDGCAISEPRRRARESQRRYASKKTTKAKRAAYMRDYYQRKKAQLALQSVPPLGPSSDSAYSLQTYAFPAYFSESTPDYPDALSHLLELSIGLPTQAVFHPSHLPHIMTHFSDFSDFLTERGSLPLPANAVITTSTYDIPKSVLTPNLGQNRAVSQTHSLCACCRAPLPPLARTDFLHTTIKTSKLGGE